MCVEYRAKLRNLKGIIIAMKNYIHEATGWPDMKYDESAIHGTLIKFYQAHGRLHGKLDALGFDVQNNLILNAVSDEVVTSSEIEGETLNRSSVRSSVAKRLGIETAGVTDAQADHYTEGVVEMALDATQQFSKTVTGERLFGWHAALFPTGRSGIRSIKVGSYRENEMSIVSGAIGREKVHFTGPASELVPGEMKKFLEWLEESKGSDPYIKAGIAHFWFETIHPFDDGNGRVGRAIADLMLARAENNSKRFYSLSSQFLKERKAYYNELETAQRYNGKLEWWIDWFIGCLTRAVETSEEKLEKAKQKAVIFELLRKTVLNKRQISMLDRLTEEFEGKLTTAKWAKLCKCSHDTALRDIDDLINKGILQRSTKGGRSTSYDVSEGRFS